MLKFESWPPEPGKVRINGPALEARMKFSCLSFRDTAEAYGEYTGALLMTHVESANKVQTVMKIGSELWKQLDSMMPDFAVYFDNGFSSGMRTQEQLEGQEQKV